MPYESVNELPESVRNSLPAHAQDIYKEAFNNAWEEYAEKGDRQGGATREETAHKVAWAAVKRGYHKNAESGRWERN